MDQTLPETPQTAPEAPKQDSAFPFPVISILLVVACVAAYIWQVSRGMDWLEGDVQAVLDAGGNLGVLTLTGDFWRLAASMFLHVGISHLLFNMSMLVSFGPVVEKMFGKLNFLVIYLVTGVGASLVSAHWNVMKATGGKLEMVVSAGASGAIMGLVGASLAGVLMRTGAETEQGGPELRSIVTIIGINLVIGAILPGVDNACHVGGLAAGIAIGSLLSIRVRQPAMRLAQTALVLTVAGGAAALAADARDDEDLQAVRARIEARFMGGSDTGDASGEAAEAVEAMRAQSEFLQRLEMMQRMEMLRQYGNYGQ